jgi:hypothetical protein
MRRTPRISLRLNACKPLRDHSATGEAGCLGLGAIVARPDPIALKWNRKKALVAVLYLGCKADEDLAVTYVDLDGLQPYRAMARMNTGLDVELVAMPGTHDIAPCRKPQTQTFFLRCEQFFHTIEHFPLADGASGVGTGIFVSKDSVADAKYPDLHRIDGKDTMVTIGHIAQCAKCDFIPGHRAYPLFAVSAPACDGTTSPRRTD